MPQQGPHRMHPLQILAAWALCAPGLAHANLSHITRGDAVFLLLLVMAVICTPPWLASRFFTPPRRSYLVALAAWVVPLFSAFFIYGALPWDTRKQLPLMTFPAVVATVLLAYLGLAFFLSRRGRKTTEP
jgi:hypothetical protein